MAQVQSETAGREIVTVRTFKAPPAVVFAAFTAPESLAQWWGPNGFATTTLEMHFAVGGVWRFIMHGPDGTDYPNKITYTAIVPNELIEYDHNGDDDGPAHFHTIAQFRENNGGTELTFLAILPTVEAYEKIKGFAVEGAQQTIARLALFVGEGD